MRRNAKGEMFSIGVLDTETTGLYADFGYILVAVIKDVSSGKYHVFRLDNYVNYRSKDISNPAFWRSIDRDLLIDFSSAYSKFDFVFHYNGRNFDIKFLNTRLLKNGLPILPPTKQLDLYQLAKHRLRIRSKRLGSLKEFLGIGVDKDGHKWEYWQMASCGIKAGFDYVTRHCCKDVDDLERATKLLKAHINFISRQ